MSGGDLAAFVFYAILVASSLATISEVIGELQRAAGATERLIEILQVNSLILSPKEQSANSRSLNAEITFKSVSFCYPSRPEQTAIQTLNLTAEPGKVLALVGPSGAGKSTLFELLQRFYDPQQGHITYGGIDIKQLNPQKLRQKMALVPQQPALFSHDVMHNIRYGSPNASDEEVIAAAKQSHAHEFIINLPEGYKSFLGERGVRLSGGQRQRIAIARAILKAPDVLLLDEATSALDSESEYHVQQGLAALMHGRTTLIIAHRLSTIQHADSIAVLEQGRVIATGSHQSLLSSCPLYQRLVELQLKQT
jgi:ATP-binding cassette subfamily B protein